MKRSLCALVLSGFLAVSCVSPVTHNTPSGKPEVTVTLIEPEDVRGALISEMMSRGYTLNDANDFLLSFDRPVENFLAAALLGSQYDSTPNARITFSIAPIGDSVRVVADLAIITNPGSGFERRTDMNQGQDSPKIQQMLYSIRDRLQATNGPTPL